MNNIENLQRGDLVVFSCGYYIYPTVFHSFGFNRKRDMVSVRGFSLQSTYWLKRIKEYKEDLDLFYKDNIRLL